MCGRYTLHAKPSEVMARFGLGTIPGLVPRYNVSPSQSVAVVRDAAGGGPELVLLGWGLVPSWADDPSIGYKTINARSETAATRPAFRSAFRHRRCLVVADGFYEWAKLPGGKKQPHHFRLTDGGVYAFAGLWESWTKGPEPVETCTILTTGANGVVGPVHDRMPVMLHPADYATWLDAEADPAEILRPYPDGEMEGYPVSALVGSPKNDVRRCIERAG